MLRFSSFQSQLLLYFTYSPCRRVEAPGIRDAAVARRGGERSASGLYGAGGDPRPVCTARGERSASRLYLDVLFDAAHRLPRAVHQLQHVRRKEVDLPRPAGLRSEEGVSFSQRPEAPARARQRFSGRRRSRRGGRGGKDETCPLSTEGWTRRVHFVREGGGGSCMSQMSSVPLLACHVKCENACPRRRVPSGGGQGTQRDR